MKRWLFFFIVIALGIGTVFFLKGFFGGQKGDIPLNALREDYKTDYVLMIAESYNHDKDLMLAIARLNELEDLPPSEIVQNAIDFAAKIGYNPNDITQLQLLADALQTVQPPTVTPTIQ